MKEELLAGRYQLEQELGRGGMATVFLATDVRLGRRVAVKVMHPGEEDERRAERFHREASLAASLKHPNVLEVHDFGVDAVRGPFLVCEWVQGESLRELARRLAPVPPELTALLGWELARALEAAHARGVVHRDVKPDNVLVAKGGPLKLADFGIAALAGQERLTSTGSVTGSLSYMAPERIDTGAWSPASDVYAVGVILFELCTGTTPHAGKGSAQLAVSVMTRDAPPLAEVAPGTPESFAALVDRCLARDARARPVDGGELAARLEAVVARLVGPPAEASRQFFQEPEAEVARWREARFQRLLSQGQVLLSEGEGARAARLLNEALTLKPGSPEVLALLRARPKVGRAKVLGGSAVVVGLVSLMGGGLTVFTASQPVPSSTALQATAQVSEPAPRVDAPASVPAPPLGGATVPGAGAPVRSDARPSTPARPRTQPASPPLNAAPRGTQGHATPGMPRAGAPRSEATGHATLTVMTRPWAEVFVDGQSRGYTPRVRELRLSPGRHRLRFDNPLCDGVEEVIDVSAGETVSREIILQVRKAEVTLVAPAGTRLFLDGVEVGVAPLRAPVRVTHGAHVLSARGPGGDVLRQDFEAVAGERTEVVLGGRQ